MLCCKLNRWGRGSDIFLISAQNIDIVESRDTAGPCLHYCMGTGFLCASLTHKCECRFCTFGVWKHMHANVLVISISFGIYVGYHVK